MSEEENEIEFVLAELGGDTESRAGILQSLIRDPEADQRLVPVLEALLEDTTPCVVMKPYHFAEIRWLAARALSSVVDAMGAKREVPVDAVPPISSNDLGLMARSAGITSSAGGHEFYFSAFKLLRDQGKLSTKRFVF